jgi:RsiW-degrading membrane proteinase PrsW (M82 family)
VAATPSPLVADTPGSAPQRDYVRRFGWLVVLIAGVVLFEVVRRALRDTGNPNFVPSLILLGAAVMPATFVAFVYARRLPYSAGPGLLMTIALVGGVIGVVTAGLLEYKTLLRLGALPMISVALIEEACKLIIPVLVFLALKRVRNGADGLLMGVASGAGFAALETMGYGFVVLIQSGGSLDAVDKVLVVRGLLSPAGHMAWTGLTAAAIGAAFSAGWTVRSIGLCVLAYAIAVGLHTTWDTFHTIKAYVVLAAIAMVALAWTAHELAVHARRPAHTVAHTRW